MGDSRAVRFSLVVLAAVLVGTPVLFLASDSAAWVAVAWAALIAALQWVSVPAPSGDSLLLGVIPAAAMPLLVDDPATVGAAYGVAVLLGAILRFAIRHGGPGELASFVLAQTTALAVYGAGLFGTLALLDAAGGARTWAELLAVGLAGILWFTVRSFVRAAVQFERQGIALRYQWLLALGDWPMALSLVSTAALFGFAYPVIGWWSLLVAAIPYGFSHVSFVRYAGTRVTYGQTIRALARIPEVAGLAAEGHSARTADLAVAIAKDLGLDPSLVTEIEYAALMHDIGRITLNEPAILKAGYTDEDIARWGSQIIAEAPFLVRVADYVLHQHEPYRRPGEEFDEALSDAAKIIKVSSAYDQATADTGLPPIEAVEVLHRGAAYDFDPRVVSSLRRVVTRRGELAH